MDPILPPRPNLGPELLAEPASVVEPVIAVIAGTLFIVCCAWWLIRRRRRGRSRKLTASIATVPAAGSPAPEHEMIAWANAVRSALVARFGLAWAAKTSEEIAAATELAGWLDSKRREQLVGFLYEADRVKFAAAHRADDQGCEWAVWVTDFLAESVPDARALSRIKGR